MFVGFRRVVGFTVKLPCQGIRGLVVEVWGLGFRLSGLLRYLSHLWLRV